MKSIVKGICLLLVWGLVAGLVTMVDPIKVRDIILPGAYLPFYSLLSLAVWYTFFVILNQFIPALVITSLLLLGIYLSMSGIMNLFLGLVLAAMIVFSLYLSRRH